jgi:hypothetical protein
MFFCIRAANGFSEERRAAARAAFFLSLMSVASFVNALLVERDYMEKAEKMSTRCGKLICPNYDPKNKVSKCKIYTDRRLCAESTKQRKKQANHSRRNPGISWGI